MVKITSDEQFLEIVDRDIKGIRKITRAREELLESMQSGFKKSDRPFDPTYLIVIMKSMNDMLGEISIFAYMISKAVLNSQSEFSNRDQNIELLNALLAGILDKTEEYDKAVSKINKHFKDLESIR